MFKKIIEKEITRITKIHYSLEIPPNPELGDYSLACFALTKKYKKSPQEIAEDLAQKIKIKNVNVEFKGPYLNFFIDRNIFAKRLKNVIKENFGKGGKKGKIIIDYSQPNIAKHMGIHNMRSTVIGNSIYKLHKFSGYDVKGINYIGDWGTNFGQLIVAAQKWGKKIETVEELNKLYVKFHKESEKKKILETEARVAFKKLEDGDKEAIKFWKLFRDISLKDYDKIYNRLGIKFDEIKGEAEAVKKVPEIIKLLKEKKLLKKDEGAQIVKLKNMPPCLIVKSDGASTYAARDLAAAEERLKEKPKKILYVVDIAQKFHFEQVFSVLDKIKKGNKEKLEHIIFGRLSFPDKKMSTRKGNIIILEKVLDKSVEKVLKIIKEKNPKLKNKKEIARKIGIGSVIFFDLIHERTKDIIFTWEKILDLEGDTCPYIQYAHARCCSILKKEKRKGKISIELLTEDSEYELIKNLIKFPEIIEQSTEEKKPSILARYLIDTARTFNTFYRTQQIIGEDKELMNARLLLVEATKKTISKGLNLLGIESVNEM